MLTSSDATALLRLTTVEGRTAHRRCAVPDCTRPPRRRCWLVVTSSVSATGVTALYSTPHRVCDAHAGEPPSANDLLRPAERAIIRTRARDEHGWARETLNVQVIAREDEG